MDFNSPEFLTMIVLGSLPCVLAKMTKIIRDKRGVTIKAIGCKKKVTLPIGVTIIIVIILLFVTVSGCTTFGIKTSAAEPDVKIINPENKQTVAWHEEVGGTAKNIPDNQKIWILAYSKDLKRYYPLAEVTPKDDEWMIQVTIGFKKDYNKEFDIIAVLPDKTDQDKFSAHLFNATTGENEENIHLQGIYDLQEDTKEYDKITVTREDKPSSLDLLF